MEWPIARGINGDEKVEIQILAHNRSTFIKKDDKSFKSFKSWNLPKCNINMQINNLIKNLGPLAPPPVSDNLTVWPV